MEPRLKIDVNSTNVPNNVPSTSSHQMPPPSSADWNQQFNSPPDGAAVSPKTNGLKCFSPYSQEDMGPFVEQLLPFVRASAYNWIHLQASKRRHYKEFDRKMLARDENRKLAELQNDRDELKVKWASRLLGKIKKDIQSDHKDAFVAAISGAQSDQCILSVADQKGKMRRIDCLRQADKVWRLDLVTIILFKGIPLESTDGERLERTESCKYPNLCINPFHMAISVRGLDIFMAKYLKDVDTKITLTYGALDMGHEQAMGIKQEPGEMPIVAPHAILGTSATHNRVWEHAEHQEPIVVTYDPQKACHTYFVSGGRNTLVQQSTPNPYSYFSNKNAIDNNYYDPKRSILCLPPPPPPSQSCLTALDFPGASTSDSQQLEISEDSNDEPLEKRSRELSSHDSPNSSTNDEVRRIVESGGNDNRGLILGQSSTIWSPSGQYARVQATQAAQNQNNRLRPMDFRGAEGRGTAFRPAKPIRRMTVNAGNHGDVGVVVVDERNPPMSEMPSIHVNRAIYHPVTADSAQNLVNALNSLRTSPLVMRESPAGRKRLHPNAGSPLDVLSAQCVHDVLKSAGAVTASDVSPPHAAVANLISRESSGYMASPTKFTTARGDTTSFSKIFQKVGEKFHQNLQPPSSEPETEPKNDEPSTSFDSSSQSQPPPILSSKPVESSVQVIVPVALKPQQMPISTCNSVIASPVPTTSRIVTPFRTIEEEALASVILTHIVANSNHSTDSIQDQFLQYINDSNSRSPLLATTSGTTNFSALTMGGIAGLPQRPEGSVLNNGSNSLTAAIGLVIPPPGAVVTVPQAPTAAQDEGTSESRHPPTSPNSSNSSLGAANQAPVSNAPKDPNAPKLPTDFSQAMREENN